MTGDHGQEPSRGSRRPVVLVASVGPATGSKAAAAALACAGSEPDRAGLLIDLTGGRSPRPSLVATSAARELEERLAVHLPEAGVASRGATCHLSLAPDEGGVELVAAALPLVRDSVGVVHLLPSLLQSTLKEERIGATGALLVADLARDRALTALAAWDLLDHGLCVAVLKRPLGWLTARRALLGAFPGDSAGLPDRLCARLLKVAARPCYRRQQDANARPRLEETHEDRRGWRDDSRHAPGGRG